MNMMVTEGIIKVNTAIGTKGIAVMLLVMQTSTNPGGSQYQGPPTQAIKQGESIWTVVIMNHGKDNKVELFVVAHTQPMVLVKHTHVVCLQ